MTSTEVVELVDGLLCQRCSQPRAPERGYRGCPCRVHADAERRASVHAVRERRRHERALTMLGPGQAA